jgi:hypothetical protein
VRRPIPEQPFYLSNEFTIAFGSLLMFSTIMSEFHFVITSVWRSQMIGLFGFIFLNFNLMIIVVSTVSVLITYLTVQAQNWSWAWRSYFMG